MTPPGKIALATLTGRREVTDMVVDEIGQRQAQALAAALNPHFPDGTV